MQEVWGEGAMGEAGEKGAGSRSEGYCKHEVQPQHVGTSPYDKSSHVC